MDLPEEQKHLGYKELNAEYLYRENEINRDKLLALVESADIVIFAGGDESLIHSRKAQNKIIFYYSERPLKKGFQFYKYLYRYIKWRKLFTTNPNAYLLCSSAYTYADFIKFGMFKDKAYKWGYFPKVDSQDNINLIIDNKTPHSILWVARLMELKHPEVPLQVAKMLKQDGYNFTMNLIGRGELEKKIIDTIKEYGLEENVKLLGAMPTEQVHDYMRKSEMFIFTSDFHEGWGAVLNEAMSNACAVVASHAIGATKFLIKNGTNGFVYKNGDVDELYKKVKLLLDDSEKRKELSINAYDTMANEWNPTVAADRLINLFKAVIDGKDGFELYKDGPCSKAEIVSNDWYKG